MTGGKSSLCFKGVYRAEIGTTVLVASTLDEGQTFQESLTPSRSSTSSTSAKSRWIAIQGLSESKVRGQGVDGMKRELIYSLMIGSSRERTNERAAADSARLLLYFAKVLLEAELMD